MTKEDLMQISELMDQKLTQQKQEIVGLMNQQKQEIIQECTANMNVLIESMIQPQFNLLAEGQAEIREKMISEDRIVNIEDRLDMLEAAVRLHGREIAKLKKAQ